jgi:hypothetical protein
VGRVSGNRNIFNKFSAKRILNETREKKKKNDGKFPIKKIQLANFDRVGQVRGNTLIFNFGLKSL